MLTSKQTVAGRFHIVEFLCKWNIINHNKCAVMELDVIESWCGSHLDLSYEIMLLSFYEIPREE